MNYIGVTYDKMPFYCGDMVQIVKGENAGLTGVVQKFNGFGCYVKVPKKAPKWYLYDNIKGMDKELNLCEILKGHKGETFYSPAYGEVTLEKVITDGPIITKVEGSGQLSFNPNGSLLFTKGECMLFPSKDQRDWNKWIKEQEPKVPKTWNELCATNDWHVYTIEHQYSKDIYSTHEGITSIEKSVIALLKIHQLIEVGYGGNVSKKKWEKIDYNKWIIKPLEPLEGFDIRFVDRITDYSHVAFSTVEQAKEFLKYPENIQLLKDYFMI